ncbi:Glycerate kinase [Microbacterium sp. C448]|uniref:glycerate kinase n=1 Tax=Microbacterium sp. C448 TaxID=1177594 RepID=UPI0003DE1EBC|nr:glycerate kinase [Microbacterium sp. C448]CDJ99931.1 Glycerate kinase [Microbacterium sp. C448]
MPRIVMAPDSFKGTLTATDAANALADGWRSVRPGDEIVLAPMADGGEGTLDALAAAVARAVRVPVTVHGHDGTPIEAVWLHLPAPDGAGDGAAGGVGVVELACTSGIELLGGRLLPWTASTRGFGVAIANALSVGVSRLVLAIGSSASTDGGVGVLRALGARFTDSAGASIGDGVAGLEHLVAVDLEGLAELPPGGVRVLTDVTNPLLGPQGAASVFGPQKGLDAEGVVRADVALARLASLVPSFDPATPGAGAAGGTGWALGAWGAELVAGAPEIAALTGLADRVASAQLVITGEGSYDPQSAAGKVPACVTSLARGRTALVAGRIDPDADTSSFAASVSLADLAGSLESAIKDPAVWLRASGAHLARELGPRLADDT